MASPLMFVVTSEETLLLGSETVRSYFEKCIFSTPWVVGSTFLLSSSLENLKVWCTMKGVCMDLQGHTFSSDSRIKKSFFSDSVNGSAIQFYGTAFSFFGIFSVYLIHIN